MKNFIFRRGFKTKNNIYGGFPEKRRALTFCRFKRGLGEKEEGDVFEGEEVNTPMYVSSTDLIKGIVLS